LLAELSGCNTGSTAANSGTCPVNAPLFSAEVGTQLINAWGDSVLYFSPYGAGGYTDSYVGAAYFTGAAYFPNAVLLPTVSSVTRSGSQEIYNYFTKFLAHGPQMINNPAAPKSGGPFVTAAGCGYGVISGYYNFTYLDGSPETTARYTFQFQYATTANNVLIQVESGIKAGTIININQPSGWYVMLQNSGKLPSTIGLPQNLIIK
jgi:hypothetical protein